MVQILHISTRKLQKNMKYIEKLYFRLKQYNEREWFDKIIHWFAPEGQEIMELYATDETTLEKNTNSLL